MEERRYVIDVLGRVEMLACLKAFSRLYREAEAQMYISRRVIRTNPLTWDVPDEIAWQLQEWERISAQPIPSRR